MSAKIVAITQPLIGTASDALLFDGLKHRLITVEEFLAYVARVSNPSNQNNTLTARKLLKYLVKNKHWSPFEMVHAVMDINTTRDIGRQILRHRSFSFQEFSQRYADPTSMVFHTRAARKQDPKNRQNSFIVDDAPLQEEWFKVQDAIIAEAKEAYEWAIYNGIAKEQARVVLPEGLTPTRMYMGGTLRSWIHYCDLRMKEGTQKEHRDIAVEAWDEIKIHFPSLEELVMGTPEWDDKGNFIR
jgi:thymidylate synthase (FAD)